jgi:hypothetical protein
MDRDLLESYVEQGMSTYDIMKLTDKCQSSVRYWLRKYNLKTKHKSFKDIDPKDKINKHNQYCEMCKVKLNDCNAYLRKEKNRNCYHNQCKKCFSKILLEKRESFKKKAIEYSGGCCLKCGYIKDITVLEFHHLDSTKKEFNPSAAISISWELAKKELDKCILLCSNCHREEHHNLYKLKKMKGEFDNFKSINFSKSILTGKNTGEKSCNMCDIIINSNNKVKGKNRYICKKCDSKRMIKRIQERKRDVVEYMGGCCSICGYDKCVRALEFHHLEPSKKSKDYDKNFDTWNIEKKKSELDKCIIVCSNCHRELHTSLRKVVRS